MPQQTTLPKHLGRRRWQGPFLALAEKMYEPTSPIMNSVCASPGVAGSSSLQQSQQGWRGLLDTQEGRHYLPSQQLLPEPRSRAGDAARTSTDSCCACCGQPPPGSSQLHSPVQQGRVILGIHNLIRARPHQPGGSQVACACSRRNKVTLRLRRSMADMWLSHTAAVVNGAFFLKNP